MTGHFTPIPTRKNGLHFHQLVHIIYMTIIYCPVFRNSDNPSEAIMFVFKFVGTMVMAMGLVVGSMATFSSETWEKLGVNVVDDAVLSRGTVININEKGIYRAPIVRFKAHNGKTYLFLSQFDRNKDLFDLKVGQEIDIVYERENPQKAQENTFWARYGPRAIPASFGGIIILIGLFVFTRGRK